jgi:hypothetical protein
LSGRFIQGVVVLAVIVLAGTHAGAQGRTELGVADSFVVEGTSGSKTDPDVRLSGYTLLGTNAAGATAVTSGVGNVYIQNSLEIGSNLYVRGLGVVFPDATTQTTAYSTNVMPAALVGGECDTNRTDILFSTNYVVTGLKVMQMPVIPQTVQVYTNGILLDSFALTTDRAAHALLFGLGAFDRLGIACTNAAGIVLFSFEGRRI